jgi:4-amino-4-deoxy-L-arabinose transferase-like glycosyltransferase
MLLGLAGFSLRAHFVLVAEVEGPLRGDVRQYVHYAWNLVHHGVFSHAGPAVAAPVPDGFREPGYPAFLAFWLWLDPAGWYRLALHGQALLGALTVLWTTLLARHWLPAGWALASGALLAAWPHHVVASATLLSEVVLGCWLMLALWLFAEALRRRAAGWTLAAGLAFSAAALTNPVLLLFPACALPLAWPRLGARLALLFLGAALLAPALWQVRNATVDGPGNGPGRAAINLVQGSWPLYHEANYQLRRYGNPIARAMFDEMEAEASLLDRDPAAGLARIGTRLGRDPGASVRWYLLRKPFLLWDWDIRIGAGDVYFHHVRRSPFEAGPLRSLKRAARVANPWLFALALAGMAVAARAGCRRPGGSAAVLLAAAALYLTAVHVVFQAEPRYAIAYRGIELALATTALAAAARRMQRRRGSAGAG